MLSSNTILQNRYRVVRELGRGGMGAVYEAIDQRVSCVVALKETLVGKDFEREAALLANLRHPGLPKVMDYFKEGDGEFLVMEFIPGHDLAELLGLRGAPFPEFQMLQWADELLKLLEYLHSRHPPIIHRDIKPSNLKVTKDGELFLLDFGLAKGAAGQMPTLMSDKSVHGYTPVYSPLEQIHGRGTDPRSDLYAFGATLYHLLTAQPPVDAPTRYATIEDEQPDPLRPPHELNSQISPAVSDVIMQTMSISRRHRPTSASELRAAFAEADSARAARERMQQAETQRLEEERAAKEAKDKAAEAEKREAQRREERRQYIPPTRPPEEKPKPAQNPPTIPAPFVPQPSPQPITTEANRAEQTQPPYDSVPDKPNRRWVLAATIVVAVVIISGIVFASIYMRQSTPQPNAAAQPVSEIPKPAASIPSAPTGMVYVPVGEFMMGRDDGDEYERPAHKVTLKPFFIDVDEVTNEDYMKFIRATGRTPPKDIIKLKPRLPVVEVTWDDATAYARWAGKRLPTEEEWEFAARGTDERRYPWGNDWKEGMANTATSGMNIWAEVGTYPGKSPFGLFDMSGNVWEWTASQLKPYPGGSLSNKPTSDLRVIRGGAYDSDQNTATTTYRRGYPARGNYDYAKTGFRCAKDVS